MIYYSIDGETYSYDNWHDALNDMFTEDLLSVSNSGYGIAEIHRGYVRRSDLSSAIDTNRLSESIIEEIYENTFTDNFEFECGYNDTQELSRMLAQTIDNWERRSDLQEYRIVEDIKVIRILFRVSANNIYWIKDITDSDEKFAEYIGDNYSEYDKALARIGEDE